MTTAEFIIGHSADDAAERKKEAHKILWALLAALGIHLLIGYSLAVFGGLLYSPFSVIEEDKPVELTFVDLATPAPAKNTMFIPNDESKQTEQPKEKTFESNANSIAASENPSAGSLPLPSQQGGDRTNLDLNSQRQSIPNEGAQPQPSTAPQQSATPQPTAQPTPISKSEEFAMLTSTPTPRPSVASTPQQPKSAYQPYKEKTRLAGAITNRGTSAVNAVGTPLGRYQKILFDAVGSHWYAYIEEKADLVNLGTTRVTFWVDRNGRVKNLKVISNDSNEAFANVCLQAILDAKLPPIPEDVASALPPEGLESEISFTTFSNR
ncbi:MAG TPA: energy transducer TonB [Chthoniobacterales bacterium]|nr:energy transducer TonB [Chthoniobacterales bacterium]